MSKYTVLYRNGETQQVEVAKPTIPSGNILGEDADLSLTIRQKSRQLSQNKTGAIKIYDSAGRLFWARPATKETEQSAISAYIISLQNRPKPTGAFTDPYDGWHILVVCDGMGPHGSRVFTAIGFMLENECSDDAARHRFYTSANDTGSAVGLLILYLRKKNPLVNLTICGISEPE